MTREQDIPPTLGAVLAGGRARRLGGGDKALRKVGDRTVLAQIIDRLAPQVTRMILNANDDPERFREYGLPVIADSLPDRPGPLAGILAAMDWACTCAADIKWVVTLPGDVPFIPRDLVMRLHSGLQSGNAAIACAASQGRRHPIVALWPVEIRGQLRRAVAEQGIQRVGQFTQPYRCAIVEWPATPVDPFFNVNTPDDLAAADRLARAHPHV